VRSATQFYVGDLPGNVRKIVQAATQAHAEGAELLLTPELSLCGYAAEDLFCVLPLSKPVMMPCWTWPRSWLG